MFWRFSMSFLSARTHKFRAFWRTISIALAFCAITLSTSTAFSQGNKSQNQSGLSNVQRMDVMRSKLDAMRRSLENAIAAVNATESTDKTKNPDDPRERLRGLVKEVGSVSSEI